MEFIKALTDAKELGLSKEEFLEIWKTETRMKQTADEVLQLQQNNVPVKSNHHRESVLNHQTLSNEIRQLNTRCDDMSNSLISKFEQQKQLIHEESDKMQQQFQRFSDRVEDCNIILQVSVPEVNSEGLSRSLESQQDQEKSNEQSLGFEVTRGDIPDKLANDANLTGVSRSQMQNIRSQTEGTTINEHQEFNLPNEGAWVWNLDVQPWKPVEQNNSDDVGERAYTNVKQPCLVGTRNYANAIPSLMTQDMTIHGHNSGHDNPKPTPSYRREALKHGRMRNRNTIKTNLPRICTPKDAVKFFVISNFRVFQSTSEDFFTESLYTRPKSCTFRLRLWFNLEHRLEVRLLVSEDVLEESNQWPMIFEGCGYIFNQKSLTYTRLWVIESQMCSMPEKNKEMELDANVCLNTSRGAYDDVTSDLLIKRGYADEDRLIFCWYIHATENKVNHQATGLSPQSNY